MDAHVAVDNGPGEPAPSRPSARRRATAASSEEARQWLKHIAGEAVALRAERQQLLARVRHLEEDLRRAQAARQASGTNGSQARNAAVDPLLGDAQRWIADATENTAKVLHSGQDVADEIVQRARERASEIEAAIETAREIRRRADAVARTIVAAAHDDARNLLHGARESAEELIARAKGVRHRAIEDLAAREVALQAEAEDLEARRRQLLDTYVGIKESVDDVIATLASRTSPSNRSPILPRLVEPGRNTR